MKNKRISDQILILQAVQCVREELAEASANKAGEIETTKIMTRLASLYSCINTSQVVVEVLKQSNIRGDYVKGTR